MRLLAILGLSAQINAQTLEASQANHWHQWRGPDANGVSRTATPPVTWSERENIRWKVAIDGQGNSTPIIWDEKIFLLTAINTEKVDPSFPKPEDQPDRVFGIQFPNTSYKFITLCLDRRTGKELWRRTASEVVPHEGIHSDNSFATASPITDGERLYCWFGSAGLYCYDLDGKLLWKRKLGQSKMGASLGEGCSPALHDGKLIILRDQKGPSTIETLDALTGKTLWKKKRDEPNGWATPLIAELDGKTQVITAGSNLVRSYDLENGKIIWQCGGLSKNVIPSPVMEGAMVYCMSGYQGYSLLALPLTAKGDITNSDTIAWRKNKGTPYVPSPLLYDGMLYYLKSNQSVLTCVDAKNGKELISATRLPKVANIYASPVGADDRVYFTGRNGITLVLKRSKRLQTITSNQLDDSFYASPSMAGKQLFLRGSQFLYCIEENSH